MAEDFKYDITKMHTTLTLPDKITSGMVLPVSKETFFNTKWVPAAQPLCAYDMLYHPPDYNPNAARSDRSDPKIIRRNIWAQECHKAVPSTSHLCISHPHRKPLDLATKQFVKIVVKNENPYIRIYNVLEWAVLLTDGRTVCDQ